MLRKWCLGILVFSVSMTSFGESSDDISETPLDEKPLLSREINGIIVDRTITRFGHDFYSYFTKTIYEQYPSLEQNILVKERPTALSGSIITVFHLSTPIYRTALSPGRRQAEDKSTEAFNALKQYIVRWELERKYKDNSDLAESELY